MTNTIKTMMETFKSKADVNCTTDIVEMRFGARYAMVATINDMSYVIISTIDDDNEIAFRIYLDTGCDVVLLAEYDQHWKNRVNQKAIKDFAEAIDSVNQIVSKVTNADKAKPVENPMIAMPKFRRGVGMVPAFIC